MSLIIVKFASFFKLF